MESDIVQRLRDPGFCCHNDWIDEAADEIEELRRQLTHARELCSRRGYHREQLERELVAMREQRDEACQRTYNAGFVEASRIHGIEIQQLRQQRDEARREAMQWWRERFSTKEFKEEVGQRGWEYLLVEGGGA